MFRIDDTTAVAVKPAPTPDGAPGYFTKGDPLGGIPATVLTADWANLIQEELIAILTAAGVVPNKANSAQVLAAIQVIIAAAPKMKPGVIFDWSGTSPPSGALALPTSPTNISRTTYAALFAAVGTTWGAGDGNTTFGMPYCPSGYASIQASGNVGTSSVGQVIAHAHLYGSAHDSSYGLSATGVVGVNPTNKVGYSTSTFGGTDNLAAGIRLLKCIQYQ